MLAGADKTPQPIGSQQQTGTQPNMQAPAGDLSILVKNIAGGIGQMGQDQASSTANVYQSEMSKWQNEEKYWFNPESDVKPDLEKYMSRMPSQTESLEQGSWMDQASKGTAGQVLLNPLGKAGGEVGYLGAQGGEGAIKGFANGGWIGAIGGAVTSVIKGIFSWSSAKQADVKAKSMALSDYQDALKRWQQNQNKQAAASALRTSENYQEQDAKTDAEKAKGNQSKRSVMIGLINDMMNYKRPSYQMPVIGGRNA
jgi:hypothetical protein